MREYYGEGWHELLAANQLDSFDALWNLKTDWFEEPNIRRGGWSAVVRIVLDSPTEGKVALFMKRQENHTTKTFFHPLRGISTFEREFRAILRFRKNSLPTLEPVYFSRRNHQGNLQAILITKELEGYESLDSGRFLRSGDVIKDKRHRDQLLASIARVMRAMHDCRFQHNCFYPKHLFAKSNGDSWDIRIIDLEKVKWTFKKDAMFRDLFTLHRHTEGWLRSDRVKLLRAYRNEAKLSDSSKRLWRAIEKKAQTKALR